MSLVHSDSCSGLTFLCVLISSCVHAVFYERQVLCQVPPACPASLAGREARSNAAAPSQRVGTCRDAVAWQNASSPAEPTTGERTSALEATDPEAISPRAAPDHLNARLGID